MTNAFFIAIAGILMGLWVAIAATVIWQGLSMRRRALDALRKTVRLARLLETAPAIPVVVRSDGRLETSDRFSRLLGLSNTAQTLLEMHENDTAGLAENDLKNLDHLVRETQRTGKNFSLSLVVAGSDRRLMVIGNIADAIIYPNGAALLWFFDLTDTVRDLEQAHGDVDAARSAFASLAGLIEAAPIPMWHRSPDLRLNFVNQAYAASVGANDGDDVVENGIELIEPLNGATAKSFAANAAKEDVVKERLVSTTIEGERRNIRVFDIPLGPLGVAGMAIDVQEEVQLRGEIRRLSDAQRDLLNLISAGVAQFDPDHVLSFANQPFQRLFTFRDQWLSDKPEFARVLDRMRENGKLPEVRDFPEWRQERENWFLSAQPNEENWLLSDGTHLRVLAQPTPDGGLLLIFEDRTEQVQLASARDTLLRVRTATFDNLVEAIAVFASDGKLSIWNRQFAQNWQLSEDVLVKHPRLDEILPIIAGLLKKPAQVSIIAELLRMTTANREQRRSRIAFADGRLFQISTVPLPDGNALFTMLDMTDSIQIEQALRDKNAALLQADEIKGKFLGNMSYEFRTPLTSISGFADLLKVGIAGKLSKQAIEYVDAILLSADRLTQQINTVLDYSQGQAGALPIARAPVDMNEVLETLLIEKSALAERTGIDLKTEIKAGLGKIAGDEYRLHQAIGHIIDNAIQYGGAQGQALLIARSNRKEVEIIVSDSGPGISTSDQARLFSGLPNQNNAKQGLGLPLAKQLIEAHGGGFYIESKLGEGTTVIMRLPRT